MKAIVIGSGGREHTIAWTLSHSDRINEILCIPGNGGTAAEEKCTNSTASSDIPSIVAECKRFFADAPAESFVVIGPEDPLAHGLADALLAQGIAVVGPTKAAAELEASKDFAKSFMDRNGIACATSKTFTVAQDALEAIEQLKGPYVIKADGLAAGKGVVVTAKKETARKAVLDFMDAKTLGSAGAKLVIEEYLEGDEISILAAVSVSPALSKEGKSTIEPFMSARDHKRLLDGALGPNTGGMGAIAPVPGLGKDVYEEFERSILEPTLKGLINEGFEYRGFIFFGLMLTKDGPKLLEYNVRLGDPETQVVLPMMESDFANLCRAIVDGSLKDFNLEWKSGFRCAPVAVSKGYPGAYEKGVPISVNEAELDAQDVKVLYAGAQLADLAGGAVAGTPAGLAGLDGTSVSLQTSGGRVLAVSAYGSTLEQAQARAYKGLESIHFEGMFYRKDIGAPGAAVSGSLLE